MAQTVKKFDINTNGHDYFCTDIHGCKTKLFKLLNAIQFDFENDRLFCAGDIVNRGPESLECAMLVKEKWFHSVQGNHEDMLCGYLLGEYPEEFYFSNGGEWAKDLSIDQAVDLVREFNKLPSIIEVETKSGLIGVVHADINVSFWDVFKQRVESIHNERMNSLWGRTRIEKMISGKIGGVRLVILGHTPKVDPTLLGNTLYIDTHGISNKITIFREDNELIYSIDKYDRVQYVELEHYHKN